MKKILFYVLVFTVFCLVLPFLFTKDFSENKMVSANLYLDENQIQNQDDNKENLEVKNDYDYSAYQKIKLLHKATGQVEEMDLDEYICGVVAAEMPADFDQEALNAQSLVARTYTIYMIIKNPNKHEGASICDDSTCCQAWISKDDRFAKWEESKRQDNWNKIVLAVNSTQGKIITYNNEPINAFFHSNSGGKTEIPVNVWGGDGYPYLQTVETSGEDSYSQFASEVILTKQQMIDKIKERYNNFEIDFSQQDCIEVVEYTDGDRIKTIKIGNYNFSGVDIRSIIGLKSANFVVEQDADNVKFTVKGYGHGVGMSQTGADSLAKQGKNYEEIVNHYYKNIEIKNVDL